MFIDTHAHLTSETVLPHLEEMLKRAKSSRIGKIVNICTDFKSLEEGLKLALTYPWIYNTAATTPHDVKEEGESFFPIVAKCAAEGKLVAIGETGLDYFYEHSDRALQKDFLVRYFALANSSKLPLVFHCRDAFEDLFTLADRHYRNGAAVLHCFTGNLAEAKGVLERGWYLSCSGIATFKKSTELKDVIKYAPLDRLFIETDTPYLAPQSKRGQMNEPAYVIETAELIASLKGTTLEEVERVTAANAQKFFSFV